MQQRSGGKKDFESHLGYFCCVWSGGFCFGDKSRHSPLPAAPWCKPSCATEMLSFSLLGLKGSKSARLGNKLGSLFLFSPKPGREEPAPLGVPDSGCSWSEGLSMPALLCPILAPAAFGSGGKLLLKPLPLVWTLLFLSLIVKWLFCNDICLLIKETS